MRFLNNVTVPKNVKGGTLCDFLTSIVLQNIKKVGETLWWNPKSLKKSQSAEKNPSEKTRGGDPMLSMMLWTSVV